MIDANAGAGAAEHTTARLALVRLDHIVPAVRYRPMWSNACVGTWSSGPPRAHILGPDADDEHLPELVDGAVVAAGSYAEARQELLRLERGESIRMWNRGEINDQALAAVQRRLDLEEQQII